MFWAVMLICTTETHCLAIKDIRNPYDTIEGCKAALPALKEQAKEIASQLVDKPTPMSFIGECRTVNK